jgi:glycosyltransferase involved in cell wall biosynthesis
MKIDSISVVIPCYNSIEYLRPTLESIKVSIQNAQIAAYEVILVDDGSTDGLTGLTFKDFSWVRYHRQPNLGRLIARQSGLHLARYSNVLLIDSRVTLSPTSITHLTNTYLSGAFVSGPTEFPKDTNLVGLFWSSISRVVWWRFYKSSGPFRLTTRHFNRYPKGTTCLFGERGEFLLHTKNVLAAAKTEPQYMNDDTVMIASLVKEREFWIDKDFRAIYRPREKFCDFLQHSHHRGIVFYDGFPSIRNKIISFLLVSTVIFLSGFLAYGLSFVLIFFVASHLGVFFLMRLRNLPARETISLLTFGLIFFVSYASGYVRAILK